jgi:AcrR family transcriptional regulator
MEPTPGPPVHAPPSSDRPAGRPRSATVDHRVLAATLQLFGEYGWSGLSFERIAAAARVGKSSMYLRWSNKEDLLLDAFRAEVPDIVEVDTGSLRGDLNALAQQILAVFVGPAGRAVQRLVLDLDFTPALAQRLEEYRSAQFEVAEAALERAVARNESHPDVSTRLVLTIISGGISAHTSLRQAAPREHADTSFIEQLADVVAVAIEHTAHRLPRREGHQQDRHPSSGVAMNGAATSITTKGDADG